MDFSAGEYEISQDLGFTDYNKSYYLSLERGEFDINYGKSIDFADDSERFYLTDSGLKKFNVDENTTSTSSKPKVSFVVQREAISTKYSKEDTTNSTYELMLDESSDENFLVKKRSKDSPNIKKDKGCKAIY